MIRFTCIATTAIILIGVSCPASGQKIERISFTWNFGTAYNFPTYLGIYQDGYDPIIIRSADYATEAFEAPLYWDYKLDLETENTFFGIRSTHHKLVLRNPTPDIQSFNITHGYNMVLAHYGWKMKHFRVAAGGGMAFSHPEGEIRNQDVALNKGIPLIGGWYRVTLPNLELAVSRKDYLGKRWFIQSELRFTAGYCKARIIDGYIVTYPVSLHGNLGLGYDFVRKE